MTISASSYAGLVDFDSSVILRNVADGAETSTAIETAVALNELDTAYWHNSQIPNGQLEIVLAVASAKSSDNDETYLLELIVDDVSGMSNDPVVVWSQPIPRGYRGASKIVVDGAAIASLDTDSSGTEKYLAIRATLGGTLPSLVYGASIVRGS